jgi:hypothetical protein
MPGIWFTQATKPDFTSTPASHKNKYSQNPFTQEHMLCMANKGQLAVNKKKAANSQINQSPSINIRSGGPGGPCLL